MDGIDPGALGYLVVIAIAAVLCVIGANRGASR